MPVFSHLFSKPPEVDGSFRDRRHPVNLRMTRRRRGGVAGRLVALLVLVGITGGLGYYYYAEQSSTADPSELITQIASRGPFDHIVLEQGEIESSSNTEVVCNVRSRDGTPILWVIDEGSRVKEGDKLVELDQSELELRLKEQKIEVITAQADVATAEALVEQAKIARREYLEGVFRTEEKAILSEIAIAEQNLRKAELAIESSRRLVAKGLANNLQLDADRFAVANAQNKKEAEEGKLRVLRELTQKKMLVQFDSDIEAAEAKLSAMRSELLEEENELAEVEEQIENCTIYAPTDGVVVHANRYSSRGGNAEFVVEAGANVRERQAIIRLPDPAQMQVNCKVNESRITLIEEGMPARVAVDAIPGLKLQGRVRKVNRYAEPGSWFSSSIKEYATLIEIIDPPENIRTGMTAEVQIFVEQLDDALQIPVEGLYEHDGTMYSLVRRGPASFETVPVTMKATNDTMVAVDSGLREDDQVVLNLRQHMSLMDLPEVTGDDNRDMRELAATTVSNRADESRGPGGGGSGERGAGGGGGPGEGRGGQRPGMQAGGPGGGGPGGGGRPDPETIVDRSMQRNDTDNDGKLSSEEIAKIDSQSRSRITAADADGDGSVTRAELLKSMKARFAGGGGGRG